MTYEEIKAKYATDSRGAFGNEKNPGKKHDLRQAERKETDTRLIADVESMRNFVQEMNQMKWNMSLHSPVLDKAFQNLRNSFKRFETIFYHQASLVRN